MVQLKRVIAVALIGGSALPIVLSALAAGCERRPLRSQQEQSPVLVKIDGESLTKREFDFFLPEDYQHILTSEEKWEYLGRWITTQLLYDEAMRTGFGVSSDIEARLEQYRKDLIAHRLVEKVIQENAIVSEAEILAYYEAHKEEYLKEYRVSHILVNTPEDAQKVRQLLTTRSFLWVERKYSIDKHSRAGGDLGYLSKGNMISEFENVVFGMKIGQESDVIESEFGYHIIRLADIRDARVKLKFEEVRAEIGNSLTLQKRQSVYDSLVTALEARASIEYVGDALGFSTESATDTLVRNP